MSQGSALKRHMAQAPRKTMMGEGRAAFWLSAWDFAVGLRPVVALVLLGAVLFRETELA